jgi:tetratricopeptide (TPR) repeat protein
MCDGLDCGQLWMTAPASCDRRRRLASRRRAWLLPTLAMLVFCSCLSVAGYQTSDPDVDAELRAARLYDEAVKRCGAGTREALNDCNRLLLQSVALVTNQALALLTLGHTYRTMQSWEDAIGAFRRVLTCTRSQAGAQDEAPAWVMEDARMHLGRALIELDRWDEAIQAFEAAFTAFPHASEALFRHLYLQHFACNFTRRAELLDTARERVRWEVLTHGGSRMTPSQALMMLDSAELQILAQSFAAGHLAAASTAAKPHGPWVWTLDPSLLEAPRAQAESRTAYFAYSHMHLLDSDGRLRIGYLSKDWGFSSVGQLLPRLLAAHNRRRLQVHVFCLNADDGTPTRRVLEEEAEQWHHLHAASPLQVAEHINAAGINIVLDLGGHLSVTSQVPLREFPQHTPTPTPEAPLPTTHTLHLQSPRPETLTAVGGRWRWPYNQRRSQSITSRGSRRPERPTYNPSSPTP